MERALVCYSNYSISKALFHPLNHVSRVDETLELLPLNLDAVAVHYQPVGSWLLISEPAQLPFADSEIPCRLLDGERVLLPNGNILYCHANHLLSASSYRPSFECVDRANRTRSLRLAWSPYIGGAGAVKPVSRVRGAPAGFTGYPPLR